MTSVSQQSSAESDHKRTPELPIRTTPRPNCDLCGASGKTVYRHLADRLFATPGEWELRQCTSADCNLIWLDPLPIAEDLDRLYADYYTHVAETAGGSVPFYRDLKSEILRSVFGYQSAACKPVGRVWCRLGLIRDIVGGEVTYLHARPGARLLDVGCGNGQFLAHMRDLGWDVVGIDPDPKAVHIARERFQLEVRHGTLERAVIDAESFDAVTLRHVIEHVPDPVGLLRACRRLLNPQGRLVVVTPNHLSLGRRVCGREWIGWDSPRHLFVFSPRVLCRVAQAAGLNIEQVRTTANGARFIWHVYRLLRRAPASRPGIHQRVPRQFFIEGILFWVIEYLMLRAAPLGEEVVMLAQR